MNSAKTLWVLILVFLSLLIWVQPAVGQDEWVVPAQCNAPKPTNADVQPTGLCPGAEVAQCTQNTGPTSCTGSNSQCGQWTLPIDICTGDPKPKCSGVHAALLNTGNVLFWYTTGDNNSTKNSYVLSNPSDCTDSGNCTLTNRSPTFDYDILCAGMSADVNGKIIATGGMDNVELTKGIKKTSFFTPSPTPPFGSWTAGTEAEDMFCARFYPSNVQQPSGNILVMAGTDPDDPDPTCAAPARPMELWAGVGWSFTGPDLPESVSLYPRVKLVPENSGEFVVAGERMETYIYDPPLSQMWQHVDDMTFGNHRSQGGTVLLPLAPGTPSTKIFAAGGNTEENGSGCPTNTSETFTLSSGTWGGATSQCMCYARHNHNLVLLANGTVLAVGGGKGEEYASPITVPELYDPATGNWTPLRAALDQNNNNVIVNRTYHSTALLLPDGRVISAGSDTARKPPNPGTYDNTFQIFSPPYYFATRPSIGSISTSSITYGQEFDINTVNASSTLKAALVRPGATTHANDFEQRYVNLQVTQVTPGVKIRVKAPANAGVAPPGYYMLFIVNSSNIPSRSATPFLQLQQ